MVDVFTILNIVFVAVQVLLVGVFGYQSRIHQRNSQLIITALVFGIIASIFSLMESLSPTQVLSSRELLSLQLIAFSIEYIFLFIHFNFSVSDVVDPLKLGVMSFAFGVLFIFSLKYMTVPLDDLDEMFWDLSYNALGLFAFLYLTYSLYSSFRFSGEREAFIQAVGTLFLTIGFVIGGLSTPLVKQAVGVDFDNTIADIVKAVGALIFISIFAFNVDFVERLSIDTYGMLVFDNGGKSLGFYNLRTKRYFTGDSIAVDPNLFAPLVSALLAFIKEALGTQSSMRSINVEDKAIVFEMGSKVHTALITERSTKLLISSIHRFRESCEKIAELSPVDFKHGRLDENLVKNQLKRNFPYVEILGIQ